MNFEKLILSLDDNDIQTIIRELDRDELINALYDESPEVHEKIFRNISVRLANLIKDRMITLFSIRSSPQEARKKVIDIARHLAEVGWITIDPAILQEPDDPQEPATAEVESFKVLPPEKELSAEEKTTELIQRIETAINNGGNLYIGNPFFDQTDSTLLIEKAFDFFKGRPQDLLRIKDLSITPNYLKAAEFLFNLNGLEKLSVHGFGEGPDILPESIARCSGVKELKFGYSDSIKELSGWLEAFNSLESLDISSSNTDRLPDTIGNLTSLQSLNLKDTSISSLPDSLFNLPSLTSLNLSLTHIKKLPYGLTKLKSLRELKLFGLPITKEDIPPEMASNENLHVSLSYPLIPDEEPLLYEDYVAIYQQIAARAYCWSEQARREGLLALEESIEKLQEGDFFHAGMSLVIEGTDGEIIASILSNLMEHEKDPYKRILKKMMMEVTRAIQSGPNTMEIILMLNSMVNIKNDPVTKIIMDYFTTGDTGILDNAFRALLEKEYPFRDEAEVPEINGFIKRAMMMSDAARRNGFQSLESLVVRDKGDLDIFEYGITLAIDKYDYDFIKKLLDNLVSRETEPAMKMLAILKKQAVISIMEGDSPRIILLKLLSLYKGSTQGYSEYIEL